MKKRSGEQKFVKYSKVAVPGDNIFLRQVLSWTSKECNLLLRPGRPFCASGGGHWVK
jgi:hypothetical protein